MSRLSRGGNAVLYIALVLGSVVLINLISARKYDRVDLTHDRIYTISEASKKLIQSLPDRMTVKAFISRDLPTQAQSFARYLRDTVLDYGALSLGRLDAEVVYVDADDKKAKEEASRFKIRPIKLGQRTSSKTSVQLAYLGVAFQYGGKVEALPQMVSINDLEYQLSSTIRRLIRKKKPKIGFSSGQGEPSFKRGLANAKHYLKDYDVVAVDLTGGKKPVPSDLQALLVVGPRQRFAERAKYEIDRFLMSGKSVAFFLDGMTLQTPRGQFHGEQPPRVGRANITGLEDMIRYWGVNVTADIVMDKQNRPLPLVSASGRSVLVNYPAFPVITNFSRKNPITKKLRQALMVFPSSLTLTKAAAANKDLKTDVLASTTAASWSHQGIFLFNPMHVPKPTKTRGPFTLALSLRGSFRSFFSGRPIPKAGPTMRPPENAAKPSGDKQSPTGTRLVIVGDADFISDQYLRLNPDNLLMLLNTVDYLAQDESLIGIRAKRQTRRPLKHEDERNLVLAKWGNILGLPLLFLLLGFVRWRWRKGKRVRDAEELLAERALHLGMPPISVTDDDDADDDDADDDDADDDDADDDNADDDDADDDDADDDDADDDDADDDDAPSKGN